MPIYVYFIGAVNIITKSLTAIKIGKSENPVNRLTQLQTGNPDDLVILKIIESENETEALKLEKFFHDTYDEDRLNGEWFSITAELLSDIYTKESDTPTEVKISGRRQRVIQRILKILQRDPQISARQIVNRMKWANLSEVEEALEALLRQGKIRSITPKRTVLFFSPFEC